MVLGLFACDPAKAGDDSTPPAVQPPTTAPRASIGADEPQKSAALTTAAHSVTPGIAGRAAASLSITLAAIRRSAQDVEIEIVLDRKLPPGGRSRPTLHAGSLVLRRSRHPQGALDRLVFTASVAEIDALPPGVTLVFDDGMFSSAAMATPPVLDLSLAQEAP